MDLRQEMRHSGHGFVIGQRVETEMCGSGVVAGTTYRFVLVTLDRDRPGDFPSPFNPSEVQNV